MKLIPLYANWSVRLWNLMISKWFYQRYSLSTIWKSVLKILNFTPSRRRAILNLEKTPSFEKQSTRFFFFLNMHILKTSSGWRSCPLSIEWMDRLLGFWRWGDWKSLGARASSSRLFIECNLRAHALSWIENFFFGFLIYFFIFFFCLKWKM